MPRARPACRQAGWDGIEINAGADHLFPQFLSRFWNKRDDIYGPQSMENRTRFIVSVIKEIKSRCGQDFPVQVVMNGFRGRGAERQAQSLEEGQEIARILEANGVDSLHVRYHWSGMHQGSYIQDNMFYPEPHIPLKDFPKETGLEPMRRLAQVPIAAEIKKVVSVPILTVGLTRRRLGRADSAGGQGRSHRLQPPLLRRRGLRQKIRDGRPDDVQPCTHCGTCNRTYNLPRHCRINACFGTESYDLTPPTTKKKVLVGGGPAGMQAARVAAMRGHRVTLFEKGRYLGGSVPLAAMVKGFEIEELPKLLRFFRTQVKKLGVDVQLHTEFDAKALDETKPDAVILATGGVPTLPEVKGIDRKNVIKSTDLYGTLRFSIWLLGPRLLRELTRIWMPVGKRVVIIGGAIQGCQLAEYLTKRGRKVTIVETGDELGEWLVPERRRGSSTGSTARASNASRRQAGGDHQGRHHRRHRGQGQTVHQRGQRHLRTPIRAESRSLRQTARQGA